MDKGNRKDLTLLLLKLRNAFARFCQVGEFFPYLHDRALEEVKIASMELYVGIDDAIAEGGVVVLYPTRGGGRTHRVARLCALNPDGISALYANGPGAEELLFNVVLPAMTWITIEPAPPPRPA